jgi:hypothetical protein
VGRENKKTTQIINIPPRILPPMIQSTTGVPEAGAEVVTGAVDDVVVWIIGVVISVEVVVGGRVVVVITVGVV